MNIETIANLLAAVDGQQVLAFTGVVKGVFKPQTGTNSYGEYHLQNVVLMEGKHEIKLKLDGCPPWTDKDMKGKRVTFRATKPNDKWVGIVLKDETYKEKVSRVVKVSAAADLEVDGNGQAPQHQSGGNAQAENRSVRAPAHSGSATQQNSTEAEKVAQTSPKPADPLKDIKRALGSIANAEWEVIKAADIVRTAYEEKYGEPMCETHWTGLIGRMFIELGKSGNYVTQLPHELNPELAAALAKIKAKPANG